jgi:hypothetical protein
MDDIALCTSEQQLVIRQPVVDRRGRGHGVPPARRTFSVQHRRAGD